MLEALEEVLGPSSGSGFASGGVYVFWDPRSREILYVGISGDLPIRLAQHLGLRSSGGCQREAIEAHFAAGHERIGYTVLALSSLSQASTARQRADLGLEERQLIELNERLSAEAMSETRALEGRLLAAHQERFGRLPRWNTSPGRVPTPARRGGNDSVLAIAVGELDSPLQARRTLRQLAREGLTQTFEEHLHAARIIAVATASAGTPDRDAVLAVAESSWASPEIRDELFRQGYFDEVCDLVASSARSPERDSNS